MSNVQFPQRAWIRLPSGGRLDLINPSPDAWTHSDLATKLSRTFRWSGESIWPNCLSVSQHSLLVLRLREIASPYPLSPEERLLELNHDSEEGFLGVDVISPLKPVLGEAFEKVSRTLMQAVSDRYNLPSWTAETHRLHKIADNTAAASEAVHCAGWSVEEVRNVLHITAPILEVDPLAELYGCTPWEPWEPKVAAERFLDKLHSLLSEVQEPQRRALARP
jgi:5'-deoxynucleotidase YfbR-like HD superfamily hydrolase